MMFAILFSLNMSFAEPGWMNLTDLKNEIRAVSNRISRSVTRTRANSEELQYALNLLEQAQSVILSDRHSTLPQFRCISRDDDNRRPFVPAYIDENTYNIIKHRAVMFSSIQDCERSLNDGLVFVDNSRVPYLAMCNSRDGDNARPWVMSLVDAESGTLIRSQSFQSYENCRVGLHTPLNRNQNIVFCTSRDADGVRPFVIVNFNPLTRTLTKSNNTFGSLGECKRILN